MGFRSIAEGSILADGSEQTILEVTQSGRFSGYVSLAELKTGDIVRLRQYVEIIGVYAKYWDQQYSGVQNDPAIYITPKEVASKMRVTLEQTAGVFRQFGYNFIVEEVPGVKFKV